MSAQAQLPKFIFMLASMYVQGLKCGRFAIFSRLFGGFFLTLQTAIQSSAIASSKLNAYGRLWMPMTM
jgi:hypothetical protein